MSLEKFKRWLLTKNEQEKFASAIKDGSTVYFSDEFAACYDLKIQGLEGTFKNAIIVQGALVDRFNKTSSNERFLQLAQETWTGLGFELWYIDRELQWLIVATADDSRTYRQEDTIESRVIDFEFSLAQVTDL